MINKLRENKAIKIIGNILYYLLVIIVLLILAVILFQRVSNNNASIGGIRIFNIVTESMVPEYNVGDILVSKSIDPSKVKVGDDLVYLGNTGSFQDKIITHRVIAIEQGEDGKYLFHTQGIANPEPDPVVSEDQIYGTIIYKTVILSFISKIINNLFGFYFLIFVPLTVLIIVKIIKIHGEKDDEDDEEDEESESKDEEDEEDEESESKDEEDEEKNKTKKEKKQIEEKENTDEEEDKGEKRK